jgi:hypothetical protein
MHLLFGWRCLFSRRRGRRLTPATHNNLRRFCKFRLTDFTKVQDRISLFPNVGCLRGGGPPHSRRLLVPHVCPHFRRCWTLGSFAPFPSATRAPANPAQIDSGFVRRANASLATTNCCLQTNDY